MMPADMHSWEAEQVVVGGCGPKVQGWWAGSREMTRWWSSGWCSMEGLEAPSRSLPAPGHQPAHLAVLQPTKLVARGGWEAGHSSSMVRCSAGRFEPPTSQLSVITAKQ